MFYENILSFIHEWRGYTILGLNGFNNLARPNLGGGLSLNIIPSSPLPNGNVGAANLGSRFCHKRENILDDNSFSWRYWDFGQFGNSNNLYNTLMQAPQ